jgi:hypothetical protein
MTLPSFTSRHRDRPCTRGQDVSAGVSHRPVDNVLYQPLVEAMHLAGELVFSKSRCQ